MSESTVAGRALTAPPATPSERNLGIALAVIAATQLMVSLDDTIVNIALPRIQQSLDIPAANLTWVVTAYALTFGGLLLLGGRIGDLFGRVRVFRTGIMVFTLASLAGGLAQNEAMLLGSRALQGVGAAIAAPTALSLIATTFTEAAGRNKAMGLYGAMGGLGSTVGLLLGGVLTQYVAWRGVMFVNVPIGLLVLAGTKHLVEGERATGRLDVPGAVLGTLGVGALIYGLNRGGINGFGDGQVPLVLVGGMVLLAGFLLLQARRGNPVLPLGLLRSGPRAGASLTTLLVFGGMFATYYFLTLSMQQVLHYSPVQSALAYLPFSIGMAVAAGGIAPKLLETRTPKSIVVTGLLVAMAGTVWFSRLTPQSSFLTLLLPAMLITALGLGLTFVPLTVAGIAGTPMRQLGAASGLLSTAQQLGVAAGVAILPALATAAANSRVPQAGTTLVEATTQGNTALMARAAEAVTHGFERGFLVGVGLYVLAIMVTVTMITVRAPAEPATPTP